MDELNCFVTLFSAHACRASYRYFCRLCKATKDLKMAMQNDGENSIRIRQTNI
jgi:hypothetical protein